ncbi:MAG: methyltransferase [Patescibacteria group bacterium UBA2163]
MTGARQQPSYSLYKNVSRPGFDTFLLTEYLGTLSPGTLLDMGTGTGYIAIMATQNRWQCTAVDNSLQACNAAKDNAQENGVSFPVVYSDLFSKVSGVFDCIAFNPPYGYSKQGGALQGILETIKSWIPRDNRLFAEAAFLLVRKQRKELITRFLDSASAYLKKDGVVLLLLHHSEIPFVCARYPGKVVGSARWMRLISIPAESL